MKKKKKKKHHKHPEKKSSRQILISTWPYTLAPLDIILTFLCSDFLCQLSQDSEPGEFQPFLGDLSDHMRSRGRRAGGRFPGQADSPHPCLIRWGHWTQICTSTRVCFLSHLPSLRTGKSWAHLNQVQKAPHWRFPVLWSPSSQVERQIPWDEYQVATGGGVAELWPISNAGKHSKAWQKHRQVHKSRTQQQNINKAERLGREAQRNKLVSIFVRWIREGLLGKTNASIDDVIPEETAKKASSLVQFITPSDYPCNHHHPITIIPSSPSSLIQINNEWGFPGGLVIKNSPANAGDMGSIPNSGKIPHVVGKLSPWTTATKSTCHSCWSPHALEPVLHNKRSHHNERAATKESPPLATTTEKSEQWKPSTAKNK